MCVSLPNLAFRRMPVCPDTLSKKKLKRKKRTRKTGREEEKECKAWHSVIQAVANELFMLNLTGVTESANCFE